MIHEAAGRLADAAGAFRTVETVTPASALKPEAQLHRALALAGLKRAGEATDLLRPLAANGPDSIGPRAALELATIQLANNQPDDAIATAQAALARYPKNQAVPALQFRFAEALQKKKRPAEAESRFLKMAQDFPGDAWADDAVLRAAQSALERGDFPTAGRLATAFPARFPQSALRNEARFVAARAASLSGQPKEAVAILEALVGPSSEQPESGGSPRSGEANAAGKKAVVPAPALPAALAQAARYDLALAYRALGRSAEADAILAKLAQEHTGAVTADARFLVGQSHLDAGRYADAVAPLEGYLAANPRGDVAEFAMAHLVTARLGMGQPDDAWKMLARLSREFPQSKSLPPARLRVAEAALEAHQAERAAEQFKLVAAASKKTAPDAPAPAAGKPADPSALALEARAYRGLGKALEALDKPMEAAAAFEAALELAPAGPAAAEVALAHARALELGRDTDAALKAYSRLRDRYETSKEAALAGLLAPGCWARPGGTARQPANSTGSTATSVPETA